MNKKSSRILTIALAVALVAAIAIPAAAAGRAAKELTAYPGITMYMDGVELQPKDANGNPVDVFIVDGTTYLPARALTEALGGQIGFDSANYSIYMDTVAKDDKAAEYLEAYFGVTAATSFNDALKAIFGDDAAQAEDATVGAAVKAAVESCGLKELPATYSAEKAAASTTGVVGVAEATAPYVAAALDASLASGTWDFSAELNSDTAAQLLMNAVNIAGKGRNYIGSTTDSDIASKMRFFWGTTYDFTTLNNDTIATLWTIGETIVEEKATTGFGLKSSDYDARFLDKYTTQYSHHSIDHAVQLVDLLVRNGLEAKVALEPKVSTYVYEGRLNNGGMEYDLKLEFNSVEDRDAFDSVVINYVTRELEGNTESQIVSPYRTPAYFTRTENQEFEHIYDNIITCGKYSLHPFSLPHNVENVTNVVNKVADDFNANAAEGAAQITTEVKDLWCNPAFFRYLGGEHQ